MQSGAPSEPPVYAAILTPKGKLLHDVFIHSHPGGRQLQLQLQLQRAVSFSFTLCVVATVPTVVGCRLCIVHRVSTHWVSVEQCGVRACMRAQKTLLQASAVRWLAADARPGDHEAVLLDVGAAGAAAALQLLTR